MLARFVVTSLGIALAASACGGGDRATAAGDAATSAGVGGAATTTTTISAGGAGQGGAGGGASCPRAPAPADRARKIVISHPYDAAAQPASTYQLLELATDGSLSDTGKTFSLGRSTSGQMVFTPDGAIGIVADEDGDLGVVRFDADGTPNVVHDKFTGSFYAGAVTLEASGDSALVLDPNWRRNGGGLYRVRIGCDGTLTDEGLIAAAKLARGLAWLDAGQRAVLAAADIASSPAGDDAHLLSTTAAPELVAGVDAFGDDVAVVSSAVATHDEKFVRIADNGAFSGVPNRVAVVGVSAAALVATQLMSPFDDPAALATSPYDNAAVVLSAMGNAISELRYDPTNTSGPFTLLGEIAYAGSAPEPASRRRAHPARRPDRPRPRRRGQRDPSPSLRDERRRHRSRHLLRRVGHRSNHRRARRRARIYYLARSLRDGIDAAAARTAAVGLRARPRYEGCSVALEASPE